VAVRNHYTLLLLSIVHLLPLNQRPGSVVIAEAPALLLKNSALIVVQHKTRKKEKERERKRKKEKERERKKRKKRKKKEKKEAVRC